MDRTIVEEKQKRREKGLRERFATCMIMSSLRATKIKGRKMMAETKMKPVLLFDETIWIPNAAPKEYGFAMFKALLSGKYDAVGHKDDFNGKEHYVSQRTVESVVLNLLQVKRIPNHWFRATIPTNPWMRVPIKNSSIQTYVTDEHRYDYQILLDKYGSYLSKHKHKPLPFCFGLWPQKTKVVKKQIRNERVDVTSIRNQLLKLAKAGEEISFIHKNDCWEIECYITQIKQ
jgi:hypothetical protein